MNPQVGTSPPACVNQDTDLSGRPIYPALFITDITHPNEASLAGDWQFGGTPYSPDAVFGTWKAAAKTVDMTRTPSVVTVTPDPDPAQNHWNLGSGADPVPPGLTDQGYGAEARWDTSHLPITSGHTYRLYFMIHDGDQNKSGGDVGQGCSTIMTQPNCDAPPPQCVLGYPNTSGPFRCLGGANDGLTCVQGSTTGCPGGACLQRTNTIFNEPECLAAFSPNTASSGDTIKVWYSDEHALTLGVSSVVIKTSTGTSPPTPCPDSVSPLPSDPGSALHPHVGCQALTGDFAGTDPLGRPMWPALFITDITHPNEDSKACDWQMGPSFPSPECDGKTGIPPSAVFGTWKAAVRTVDKTKVPPLVTITPGIDPAKNNWDLDGGDAAPAGLPNQGYGAEARWSVQELITAGVLIPGHIYRIQFMVHDGDQNKTGGDVGENCGLVTIGGPGGCNVTVTPPEPPQSSFHEVTGTQATP